MSGSSAADGLEGTWQLVSHRSSIKPDTDWTGLMIITRQYLSRVYMSRSRRKLPFDHETKTDLTVREKDEVIESYNLFRAGCGRYSIEGSTLTVHPIAYYNPVNFGKSPRRNFEFRQDQLILSGVTSNGDEVEEIWKRVE